MIRHHEVDSIDLKKKIRRKDILFAGNNKLKIYGTLRCISGKRMKPQNRVFFSSEKEALQNGFRPCAHCMHQKYREWICSIT